MDIEFRVFIGTHLFVTTELLHLSTVLVAVI